MLGSYNIVDHLNGGVDGCGDVGECGDVDENVDGQYKRDDHKEHSHFLQVLLHHLLVEFDIHQRFEQYQKKDVDLKCDQSQEMLVFLMMGYLS